MWEHGHSSTSVLKDGYWQLLCFTLTCFRNAPLVRWATKPNPALTIPSCVPRWREEQCKSHMELLSPRQCRAGRLRKFRGEGRGGCILLLLCKAVRCCPGRYLPCTAAHALGVGNTCWSACHPLLNREVARMVQEPGLPLESYVGFVPDC